VVRLELARVHGLLMTSYAMAQAVVLGHRHLIDFHRLVHEIHPLAGLEQLPDSAGVA